MKSQCPEYERDKLKFNIQGGRGEFYIFSRDERRNSKRKVYLFHDGTVHEYLDIRDEYYVYYKTRELAQLQLDGYYKQFEFIKLEEFQI